MASYQFEKRNFDMFTNIYQKYGDKDNLKSAKRVVERMHRQGLISASEREKMLNYLKEIE